MSRCEHGFLRGVVACPQGCHRKAPKGGAGRPKEFSDKQMLDALGAARSIKQAAEHLGCSTAALYQRARQNDEIKALMVKHGATNRRGKLTHPCFVDMTSKVCGDWTVLERAENTKNGNAQWKCRHTCGKVHVLQGIVLRSANPRCPSCNPWSRA